jgi:hypothetical protein
LFTQHGHKTVNIPEANAALFLGFYQSFPAKPMNLVFSFLLISSIAANHGTDLVT